MKLAAALIGLVWLTACFPDYRLPTCSDGKQNGDETGIDCGVAACGATAVCPDQQGCASDADCTSGNCHEMVCSEPCNDGARDKGETGVDCGMAACNNTCAAGQGCSSDADCDGGKCADSICAAASCSDGLQNGVETDKDCGGDQGCGRCTTNQRCTDLTDCDGGLCGSGQCRAPTCKDNLQNAAETDIDCGGGSCPLCAIGKACGKTSDCDGVACIKATCQPAGCGDGVLNGDETDLDCGGSCTTACADDKHCKVAADCQSSVCPKQTLVCAAPACDDGVLNGDESTADCGGSCAKKCAELDTCGRAGDCASSTCLDDRCVPASATGQQLPMIGWTATASNTLSTSTPQYAIDGSNSTNWISGTDQVPGMWFQLDMTKDQVVFSMEMDCNQQDPDPTKSDVAQAIEIAFSDDPTFKGATPVLMNRTISDSEVIKFDQPEVGRYVRVSLDLGKNRWWRIDEVRMKQ